MELRNNGQFVEFMSSPFEVKTNMTSKRVKKLEQERARDYKVYRQYAWRHKTNRRSGR